MFLQLLRPLRLSSESNFFQTNRQKLQLLCHQKLWEGSRVRPSYTGHRRQLIPRAAALEMAAAKIVIYCSGINQPAPSFLLSLPSVFLLTLVSTIPQRKTNIDLSYSLSLSSLHIYTHTHVYTHTHTRPPSLHSLPAALSFWTLLQQQSNNTHTYLNIFFYILLILMTSDAIYIMRSAWAFAVFYICWLLNNQQPGLWYVFCAVVAANIQQQLPGKLLVAGATAYFGINWRKTWKNFSWIHRKSKEENIANWLTGDLWQVQ